MTQSHDDVEIHEVDAYGQITGRSVDPATEPESTVRYPLNPWLIVAWILSGLAIALAILGVVANTLGSGFSYPSTPYGSAPEVPWFIIFGQFGSTFLTVAPILLFGTIALHALVWEQRRRAANSV